MMSKLRLALMALAFAACGGGSPDPAPVDQPTGGGTCATYDTCTGNTDCASNNCHFFMQQNFSVCTQACSAANPCPNDSAGNPITCNGMGICKPLVVNPAPGSCTP